MSSLVSKRIKSAGTELAQYSIVFGQDSGRTWISDVDFKGLPRRAEIGRTRGGGKIRRKSQATRKICSCGATVRGRGSADILSIVVRGARLGKRNRSEHRTSSSSTLVVAKQMRDQI